MSFRSSLRGLLAGGVILLGGSAATEPTLVAGSPSASPVTNALVHVRYGKGDACDCSGTAFFIRAPAPLLLTARHVWRPEDAEASTPCASLPRQLGYFSGGQQKWVNATDWEPVWESRQDDLAFVRLPADAPPPDAQLQLSTDFPVGCRWHARVEGFPQDRCSFLPLNPVADPSSLLYGTITDTPEVLHDKGAKRSILELRREYPEPGHSGAPVTIPGTDIVVGVVLHYREKAKARAVDATSLVNLIPGTGLEDRAPLPLLGISPVVAPQVSCAAAEVSRPRLNEQQRVRFRRVTELFMRGLLDSFRCEWLEFGVTLANVACAGKPCSSSGDLIRTVYDRSMSELLRDDRLCRTLQSSLIREVYFSEIPIDLRCNRSGSWGRDFGTWKFRQVLGPLSPGEQVELVNTAIFKKAAANAYAAEVALINDILFQRLQEQQYASDEAMMRLIDQWTNRSSASTQPYFYEAGLEWTRLAAECPDCQMPLGALHGSSSQNELARELIRGWVKEMIALPRRVSALKGFYAGCDGLAMKLVEGRWEIEGGNVECPPESCFRFGPSIGTEALATDLAQRVIPAPTSSP